LCIYLKLFYNIILVQNSKAGVIWLNIHIQV